MTSFNENHVRDEIIKICQRLYQRNMLAAADGNVSYRIDDSRILITPSGRAKAFIQAEDLAIIDIEGRVLEGHPSGETIMHLEVYRQCSDARSVVHAHPPTAVAWSIAQPELKELPAESLSEVILATGGIPIVPYARPTTPQMAENIRPFLPHKRVMILARHGGLSWGEDLHEACNGMERLEHSAHMLWLARSLGGLSSLPEDEVNALLKMREQIGNRTL